jgi:hypothetical protein
MIYQHKNNTTIGEFGCIVHPKYPFLGASPDGINIDPNSPLFGRMIEIKNIVNRTIDGIPLVEYWIQMQIQMEVCDLDACDFVETRFREHSTEEEWSQISCEYKGVILRMCERADPFSFGGGSPTCSYKYMPFSQLDTYKEWIQGEIDANPRHYVSQTIYWTLDQYSCVFVHRNRDWFQYAIPHIESCWNTIVKERVEGCVHRQPKKKVHTEVAQSTPIHSIQLPASQTKICLVKLG